MASGRAIRPDTQELVDLRELIERDGYAVAEKRVSQELAEHCVNDIRARVRKCLEGYGMKGLRGDGVFEGLLQAVSKFSGSPKHWNCQKFGAIDKRGWQKGLGSGRLFEGWVTDNIVQVQEMCRELVAGVLQVDPSTLTRHPEKVSVKPPGSPAFKAHLDLGRVGGVQCVIALSQGSFLVWPRSHKAGMADRLRNLGKKGFHALTKKELDALPEESATVPANIGDVLLMQGGTLVHGSPKVPDDGPVRVVAYANFDPVEEA